MLPAAVRKYESRFNKKVLAGHIIRAGPKYIVLYANIIRTGPKNILCLYAYYYSSWTGILRNRMPALFECGG